MAGEVSFSLGELTCFVINTMGFPGGTVEKNPPASVGDVRDAGLTPGLGRSPGAGNGNPLHYPCLENLMGRGWGSLVGCSPLGHKESGMTE